LLLLRDKLMVASSCERLVLFKQFRVARPAQYYGANHTKKKKNTNTQKALRGARISQLVQREGSNYKWKDPYNL